MNDVKILVVDDEVANTDIIKDSLEDVGYIVTATHSAFRAQEILKNEDIALLILDIWMPDMDGMSLLRTLREEGNTTPVIMVSGHAEHSDVVEAMRLGAIDFVKKPISDISAIVRNALNYSARHLNTYSASAIELNQPLKNARADFEKLYFMHHLQENDHNMSQVAQVSQIERTTLYRKLKELDIK